MGHAGVTGLDRRFVLGADDGACVVALVKPQAGLVILDDVRVRAFFRVVGKAFEKKSLCLEGHGFRPDAGIEGAADAPAGFALDGGDPVQVAEPDLRFVQDHGKARNLLSEVFGHQQNGPEALLEGVAQLFANLLDLLFRNRLKTGLEDRFHLADQRTVGRDNVVVYAADAKHVLNQLNAGINRRRVKGFKGTSEIHFRCHLF